MRRETHRSGEPGDCEGAKGTRPFPERPNEHSGVRSRRRHTGHRPVPADGIRGASCGLPTRPTINDTRPILAPHPKASVRTCPGSLGVLRARSRVDGAERRRQRGVGGAAASRGQRHDDPQRRRTRRLHTAAQPRHRGGGALRRPRPRDLRPADPHVAGRQPHRGDIAEAGLRPPSASARPLLRRPAFERTHGAARHGGQRGPRRRPVHHGLGGSRRADGHRPLAPSWSTTIR